MKSLIALFVLCFCYQQSSSQWTIPRLIDSTSAPNHSNPFISIGPHRELSVFYNESGNSKLVSYKSTDLGLTFSRTLIAQGGSGGLFYWDAGTPTSVAYNRMGDSFLCSYSGYGDGFVWFVSNGIRRMKAGRDTNYSVVWSAQITNGLSIQSMDPVMKVQDSVLHVIRSVQERFDSTRILYSKFSGDSLQVRHDVNVASVQNIKTCSDVSIVGSLIRLAFCMSDFSLQNFKLFYCFKQDADSTFSAWLPIDTINATMPQIVEMGQGKAAIIYNAGSVLTIREITDDPLIVSPPRRLTAKPVAPYSGSLHSSRIVSGRLHGSKYYVAYRTFNMTSTFAAYYEFDELNSAPTDSSFFPGFDYPDVLADSLGGRYVVMVGPGNRVYLSKKDVINDVRSETPLPAHMKLEQNYPNPFNPTTTIRFGISQRGAVELIVYDVLGRKVKELVKQPLEAGDHNAVFDGSSLSSGVYFYRLRSGGFFVSMKMLLLR